MIQRVSILLVLHLILTICSAQAQDFGVSRAFNEWAASKGAGIGGGASLGGSSIIGGGSGPFDSFSGRYSLGVDYNMRIPGGSADPRGTFDYHRQRGPTLGVDLRLGVGSDFLDAQDAFDRGVYSPQCLAGTAPSCLTTGTAWALCTATINTKSTALQLARELMFCPLAQKETANCIENQIEVSKACLKAGYLYRPDTFTLSPQMYPRRSFAPSHKEQPSSQNSNASGDSYFDRLNRNLINQALKDYYGPEVRQALGGSRGAPESGRSFFDSRQ